MTLGKLARIVPWTDFIQGDAASLAELDWSLEWDAGRALQP